MAITLRPGQVISWPEAIGPHEVERVTECSARVRPLNTSTVTRPDGTTFQARGPAFHIAATAIVDVVGDMESWRKQ